MSKGTKEIRTKRFLLRQIRISDYEDIYKYTSKEEVARYVTWTVHKNIDETKELCKIWAEQYKNNDKYHWQLYMKIW